MERILHQESGSYPETEVLESLDTFFRAPRPVVGGIAISLVQILPTVAVCSIVMSGLGFWPHASPTHRPNIGIPTLIVNQHLSRCGLDDTCDGARRRRVNYARRMPTRTCAHAAARRRDPNGEFRLIAYFRRGGCMHCVRVAIAGVCQSIERHSIRHRP